MPLADLVVRPSPRTKDMQPTCSRGSPQNLSRRQSFIKEEEESEEDEDALWYPRTGERSCLQNRGEDTFVGKRSHSETESLPPSPLRTPKPEFDDTPCPANGQAEAHQSATPESQGTVQPQILTPRRYELEFRLVLSPCGEAEAMECEARQSGHPYTFEILDLHGRICVAALCDSEQSRTRLREELNITLRRDFDVWAWVRSIWDGVLRTGVALRRACRPSTFQIVTTVFTIAAASLLVLWGSSFLSFWWLKSAIEERSSFYVSRARRGLCSSLEEFLRRLLVSLESLHDEKAVSAR